MGVKAPEPAKGTDPADDHEQRVRAHSRDDSFRREGGVYPASENDDPVERRRSSIGDVWKLANARRRLGGGNECAGGDCHVRSSQSRARRKLRRRGRTRQGLSPSGGPNDPARAFASPAPVDQGLSTSGALPAALYAGRAVDVVCRGAGRPLPRGALEATAAELVTPTDVSGSSRGRKVISDASGRQHRRTGM